MCCAGIQKLLFVSSVFVCTAVQAVVVETRSLEERFEISDTQSDVIVENVFGTVLVVGYEGNVVEMTAQETIRADSAELAEQARIDVRLRAQQRSGRVEFVVETPGVCDCGHFMEWDGYTVTYDIELRVPQDVSVNLSTVNDGDIVVENVHGTFVASNVNGSIRMQGLRNDGEAKTVNGEIDAAFGQLPPGPVAFQTVNGDIDVAYPEGLAADLTFRTLHGDLWTDFDARSLPAVPVRETRQNGRFAIRVDRDTAVRIGAGGPTHSYETVNGEIYVRRAR